MNDYDNPKYPTDEVEDLDPKFKINPDGLNDILAQDDDLDIDLSKPITENDYGRSYQKDGKSTDKRLKGIYNSVALHSEQDQSSGGESARYFERPSASGISLSSHQNEDQKLVPSKARSGLTGKPTSSYRRVMKKFEEPAEKTDENEGSHERSSFFRKQQKNPFQGNQVRPGYERQLSDKSASTIAFERKDTNSSMLDKELLDTLGGTKTPHNVDRKSLDLTARSQGSIIQLSKRGLDQKVGFSEISRISKPGQQQLSSKDSLTATNDDKKKSKKSKKKSSRKSKRNEVTSPLCIN